MHEVDEDQSDESDDPNALENWTEFYFDIRIVDDGGEGVEGVTVAVSYKWQAYPDKEETDSDGLVRFTRTAPMAKWVEDGLRIEEIRAGHVVLGEDVWIEYGESLSFTVDKDDL